MEKKDKQGFGCLKLTGLGCLLMVILGGVGGFFGYRAYQRVQKEVTPLLTDFMKLMDAKDIAGAQRISVKGSMSDADLQALADMRYLFEGFQSLSINTGGISKSVNTNPMLAGTIAKTQGTLVYTNGDQGQFEAMAKSVSGQWKVLNIRINVDKSRADRFPEPKPVEAE